jgi:hypothetical protein
VSPLPALFYDCEKSLKLDVQLYEGALPDPVATLESYLAEGGVTLAQAVFANTFFIDPQRVRTRTPYFPDWARYKACRTIRSAHPTSRPQRRAP